MEKENSIVSPKVVPMVSAKGNFVKNHYIITTDKGVFMQSYQDIVVFVPRPDPQIIKQRIVLDTNFWDASPTTRFHRESFLCEAHEDTVKFISEGSKYVFKNLNL